MDKLDALYDIMMDCLVDAQETENELVDFIERCRIEDRKYFDSVKKTLDEIKDNIDIIKANLG